MILSIIVSMRMAAQNKSGEQLVIPLSEPGKPYKLDVHLMNGPIKVIVYDGKDILIDAQSEIDNDNEEAKESSNGMKRIPMGNAMELTAEEKNNSVTIHSQSIMKTIRLSLKIPQGATSLKLGSVNNGAIEVTNATGEIEIGNVNGGIILNNVSGSVVANTVNGDVVVTFKSTTLNAPMAFSTLSGNVDITFPTALKANLKLKTDMGEMFTDFDISVEKSETKKSRSESGMYHLKVEDWIHGKINGGGPEIMMKTMTGNIYIRKPKS
jgi:hypothetical protein